MSNYVCVRLRPVRIGQAIGEAPQCRCAQGPVCVNLNAMSLAEIKDAVAGLSPNELAELTAFILAQDDPDAWDKQMERDAVAGKLDFLIEEAERAEKAGSLRDWPSTS